MGMSWALLFVPAVEATLKPMNLKLLLLLAAGFAFVIWLRRRGQISPNAAKQALETGGLVIDARSRSEFNAGHLAEALNVPLDELEALAPQIAKDKTQALLLHCQSGMRSGVAAQKLKGMGYANVFNLGSLSRAREIVGDK